MAQSSHPNCSVGHRTREQVYQDIEQTLGVVPTFVKSLPDATLELEWELLKRVQLADGPIPNKYRELIGLGIAAVIKCRYCMFFHTEAAKLNDATDAEIEDALHYTKSSVGWSAYISGQQTDFEQFKKEVLQISKHVRSMQQRASAA